MVKEAAGVRRANVRDVDSMIGKAAGTCGLGKHALDLLKDSGWYDNNVQCCSAATRPPLGFTRNVSRQYLSSRLVVYLGLGVFLEGGR